MYVTAIPDKVEVKFLATKKGNEVYYPYKVIITADGIFVHAQQGKLNNAYVYPTLKSLPKNKELFIVFEPQQIRRRVDSVLYDQKEKTLWLTVADT